MEVVVTNEDRELLQDGFVEGGRDGGHVLGAGPRTDEGVLTVALEDGVQAVESGQPQVTMILSKEAGQQGDGLVLHVTNKQTNKQINK